MSIRTVLVAIMALICGLSAAVAVDQYRKKDVAKAVVAETIEIAVAAVDIPRGTTVTPAMVAMRPWPKQHVPPSAITSLDKAVDRTAMTTLIKEEPLLEGKVADGRGLAPLIPDGMRAFTIQTPTATSGVAGFVLPGNKVDVLLTLDRRGISGDEGTTTTLLQRVEIIAVGQLLEAPNDNKVDTKACQSVTLLVTPDQAAKLTLAQSVGTLHLTLRNDSDELAANTRPVTRNELRFLQEQPVDMSKVADAMKGFFDGVAARIAKKDTDQPAAQVAQPPAITKLHIRTVRGSNEGTVTVDRPQQAPGARIAKGTEPI